MHTALETDLMVRTVDTGSGGRSKGATHLASAPLPQQNRRPAGARSPTLAPSAFAAVTVQTSHKCSNRLNSSSACQAWLDPVNLPPGEAVTSEPDGSPLIFLLQVTPAAL